MHIPFDRGSPHGATSMLAAVFRLEEDLFAIDARHIVEIVPLVRAKSLGPVEPWLQGLINHRGQLVPLVDTGLLIGRCTVSRRLHSRIVVCWIVPPDADRRTGRMTGFLVEELLGMERLTLDESNTHHGFLSVDGVELGAVVKTEAGHVQLLDPTRLLTPARRAFLLNEPSHEPLQAPAGSHT